MDTYYDHEDDHVAANAETALSNWRAVAPSDPAAIQQHFTTVEQALGGLYDQADQTRDDAAKSQIMTAWNGVQALQQHAEMLEAARAVAAATIAKLDEQRAAVVQELESLTEALYDIDVYDPRLADFAEEVANDAVELAEEYAREGAFELMYDQLYSNIKLYGFTQESASAFMDVLEGDMKPTPTQDAGLRALAQLFAQDGDA